MEKSDFVRTVTISRIFLLNFPIVDQVPCWRLSLWVRRSRYPERGETSEIGPDGLTSTTDRIKVGFGNVEQKADKICSKDQKGFVKTEW